MMPKTRTVLSTVAVRGKQVPDLLYATSNVKLAVVNSDLRSYNIDTMVLSSFNSM